MILVDSNIPMYLVGAPHPNKDVARRMLERAVTQGQPLVTDAEVLQEILHRYHAIGRREAVQPAFDVILGVCEHVHPVTADTVLRAKEVLASHPALSARDAIHVAVMDEHQITTLMSFDTGFDTRRGLTRIGA